MIWYQYVAKALDDNAITLSDLLGASVKVENGKRGLVSKVNEGAEILTVTFALENGRHELNTFSVYALKNGYFAIKTLADGVLAKIKAHYQTENLEPTTLPEDIANYQPTRAEIEDQLDDKIESYENSPESWIVSKICSLKRKMGDPADAVRWYKKLIEDLPHLDRTPDKYFPSVLTSAAAAYNDLGLNDDAIRLVNQAIEIENCDRSYQYRVLGAAHIAKGNFTEGEMFFQQASRARNNSSQNQDVSPKNVADDDLPF